MRKFLVLLPETAEADAAAVVERLRAATPRGQTCSAGIAVWDGIADVDGLISAADAALYRAKEGGRDRLAWPAPTSAGRRSRGGVTPLPP